MTDTVNFQAISALPIITVLLSLLLVPTLHHRLPPLLLLHLFLIACIAGDLILSFEFELDGDGDGKIDGRAG